MLQRLRRSEAPRRILALMMAYATILGTMPAYGSSFSRTATPIKHLVVIFQENVSFDHYFGTYPNAANPKGEPAFLRRPVRLR
jgi:phospholipase C